MKKFIYFLAALIAFSATSCKDDDVAFNNVEDLDRLPMPMFRKKDNTNVSDEGDRYASKVMDGHANAIQLHWFGVEGASAYEIRYAIGLTSGLEEDWQNPARNVTYVTVPADQLHYELYNLEYSTAYRFCIRAIHPTDPAKNSKWYGMGDGRQWEDYMGITTNQRYKVPYVVDVRDKDYDAFTVLIDLNWDRSKYDQQDADTIEKRFQIQNGKFVATNLVVKPSPINPDAKIDSKFANYELTAEDLTPDEDGFCRIRITGLSESALYVVALRDDSNTKASAEIDRYYNYQSYRTMGDPGPEILIPHRVTTEVYNHPDSIWNQGERKYNACRIDTVFTNFTNDLSLAEGQVFLLEGGKAYYLKNGPGICKGFTLKTDPADILAGKGRAKVYCGGICRNGAGATQCANWGLGKEKGVGDFDAPIRVENVIFEDIDFEVPEANNFFHSKNEGWGASGNYFTNMLAKGMQVEFESFQMRNCTFQGFIRGFFRIQGNTGRVIKHLIIDNNVFFNLGMYDNNGGNYRFIHGEQENENDNICGDLQITNNTFYDTTLAQLISPTKDGIKAASKDFGSDVVWNIKVENNTFINYNTRAARHLFAIKEVPGGTSISFKRNLIALARDNNDKRALNFTCMDMRKIHGSEELHLDIRDNYSVGCLPEHLVDDGIVTNASNRFSATKNSAGAFPNAFAPDMVASDLTIKVGSTPLYSTDLFTAPNPEHHVSDPNQTSDPLMHYTDPATIWTRLQYKSDLKVTTHEIFTKNIGDQRWKTGDPKFFLPGM